MEYICVKWIHNLDNEPILLYSEIDFSRKEVRKIEIFKDGTVGYADILLEINGSRLSEGKIPTIEEISIDSQFIPHKISREEFLKILNDKLGFAKKEV